MRWQFKGVIVWVLGVVSDHWNNKTIFFFLSLALCDPLSLDFHMCVCV